MRILFVGYLLVTMTLGGFAMLERERGMRAAADHGVFYEVEEVLRDGEPRPPLRTDEQRWWRLLPSHSMVVVQTLDGKQQYRKWKHDAAQRTFTLSGWDGKTPADAFTYEEPEPDVLLAKGSFEGASLELKLRRKRIEELALVKRGFHWVSEYPYNR